VPWTTLSEYLIYLEKHGISQNAASFVSATTIRENVIGLEDKPPTAEQLDRMRELVRRLEAQAERAKAQATERSFSSER
jgi:N-acyl-D-amino-acid deacylase